MPFAKKDKVKIKCWECGKEFEVQPYRAKKAKYCSADCKYESKRRKLTYAHSLNPKVPLFPVTCQNVFCNKVFYKPWRRAKNRKYCCTKCALYVKTKVYQERLRRLKQLENNKKRNIWMVNSH